MIKIIRRAIDPKWVAFQADTFRLLFEHGSAHWQQSGIPISRFPHRQEFEKAIRRLPFQQYGTWLSDYCSVRRQLPTEPKRGLPWHQDSAVVLARRFGWIKGFVVWIPFTPVSPRFPGLEICHSRLPMPHFGNKQTGYLEMYFPPLGRRTIINDSFLSLGDVVVFDINHPHRTHITEMMTETRVSIDLRFVSIIPESYKRKTA